MADQTVTDPIGRAITLHDHTWFGHILKRRPEMHAMRLLATDAIRSPTQILFSLSDAEARLYCGSPTASGVMMVTVANIVAGHVLTAYRSKHPKGAVEWP